MSVKPYPPIKAYPDIEPYDPDSPEGKKVAAALTRFLDRVERELAAEAHAMAYANPEPERQAAAA